MIVCNRVQTGSDSIKFDFKNKTILCKEIVEDPTLNCPLKIDVGNKIIYTDYLIEGYKINVDEVLIDDSIKISQPILPLLLYRLKYIKSVNFDKLEEGETRESYKGHYFLSDLRDPLANYSCNPNYGDSNTLFKTYLINTNAINNLDLSLKENQLTIYRADYLGDSLNINPPNCLRLDVTEWVNIALSTFSPFLRGVRKNYTEKEIKQKIIDGVLYLFTLTIFDMIYANLKKIEQGKLTEEQIEEFKQSITGDYGNPKSKLFEGFYASNKIKGEVPYIYTSTSPAARNTPWASPLISYGWSILPFIEDEIYCSGTEGDYCANRPGVYFAIDKEYLKNLSTQYYVYPDPLNLELTMKEGLSVIPSPPRLYLSSYTQTKIENGKTVFSSFVPCLKMEYLNPQGLCESEKNGTVTIEYKVVDDFVEDPSTLKGDFLEYTKDSTPLDNLNNTSLGLFDEKGKLKRIVYARTKRTLSYTSWSYSVILSVSLFNDITEDKEGNKYFTLYSDWVSIPGSYSYGDSTQGDSMGDYIKVSSDLEKNETLEVSSKTESGILEGNFIK